MKWFSIKTVYLSSTIGLPSNVDSFYDPNAGILEERIILVKAKTIKDAIKKAKTEAKKYASQPNYKNCYGQTVICRYLNGYDAFELYDDPPFDLCEVFSANRIIDKRKSKKVLNNLVMGEKESKKVFQKRQKFFNRDFGKRFKSK